MILDDKRQCFNYSRISLVSMRHVQVIIKRKKMTKFLPAITCYTLELKLKNDIFIDCYIDQFEVDLKSMQMIFDRWKTSQSLH